MQDVVITMDWTDYILINLLKYLPHILIGVICLLALKIIFKAYIKK